MKPVLYSLLSLCLLAGCKKDEQENAPEPQSKSSAMCPTQCYTLYYTILFSSQYTGDDLDTVLVRTYEPGSSFGTLLSDTLYTLSDTNHYYTKTAGNQTFFGVGINSLMLRDGIDYRIEIPATGQTFEIWDIMPTTMIMDIPCDRKNRYCLQQPDSYSFAGGTKEIRGFEIYSIFMELKK